MQVQPQAQFQSEPSLDLTQLQAMAKIDNGFFHRFGTEKIRQLVDICHCQILQHISVQGTDVPNYFIKIGTFSQRIDQCIFVKAKFENLVTFVFENSQNQNQIFLLSFELFNPSLQGFCQSICQATQVVDYKTDNYEKTSIKQKINLICEGELTQDMVENIEYVGTILKTVGNVFGTVAKNVIDPAAKAEIIMNNGFQILSQKMVSEQNKQRWNVVKETASNLNDKMTEMFKPIDNAFKMIASTIGQNFNNSENKYIKNIKKFSKATAATLNNSYKKAEDHILANKNEKENKAQSPEVFQQSANQLNA